MQAEVAGVHEEVEADCEVRVTDRRTMKSHSAKGVDWVEHRDPYVRVSLSFHA